MAKISGLFIAPAIGERMQARTVVRALAGRGLEGDRYACDQGTYSRVTRHGPRHVSLIGLEAVTAANEELQARGLVPFGPHETRRNIVVDEIDVYALLGREFRIGPVHLRGTGPTTPCRVPSAVAGKSGFAEAYHDRGGILAEVLSDGLIAIGDTLVAT